MERVFLCDHGRHRKGEHLTMPLKACHIAFGTRWTHLTAPVGAAKLAELGITPPTAEELAVEQREQERYRPRGATC
jgi:hypothetical protein